MKNITTVKLKTWDEMEEEYGLDSYGNIKCEDTFTRDMKLLAGTEIKVYKDHKGNLRTDDNLLYISKDILTTKSLFEHKLL